MRHPPARSTNLFAFPRAADQCLSARHALPAALIALFGCAGDGGSTSSPATRAADASAASNSSVEDQKLRDGTRLLDLMEQAHASITPAELTGGSATRPPRAQTALSTTPPAPAAPADTTTGPDPSVASATTPTTTAAEPPPENPAQCQSRLVGELAAALREGAQRSSAPFADFARLAALRAVEPGIFDESEAAARLSPAERDALRAWSELSREAGERLLSSPDHAALMDALRHAAGKAGASASPAIPAVTLCSRVEGFGVYDELPKSGDVYRWLAGRKHRAIVYAEIDSPPSRPAVKNGIRGHEVKLTLDLSLWIYRASADADMLAWRRPDLRATDFSRQTRRDYFITQAIELPETLAPGSYRLKVSIRDAGAGAADQAAAEFIVPIELAADPSALRVNR